MHSFVSQPSVEQVACAVRGMGRCPKGAVQVFELVCRGQAEAHFVYHRRLLLLAYVRALPLAVSFKPHLLSTSCLMSN